MDKVDKMNKIVADADADADAVTPSRNTRSYTLRSVPSSPGRSFFDGILSVVYFIIRSIKNANVLMSQNLKDTTDNDDYVTLAEEEMIR